MCNAVFCASSCPVGPPLAAQLHACVVRICCRAILILGDMDKLNLMPSTQAINSVIRVCTKCHAYRTLWQLQHIFFSEKKGLLKPNVGSYNAMLEVILCLRLLLPVPPYCDNCLCCFALPVSSKLLPAAKEPLTPQACEITGNAERAVTLYQEMQMRGIR